MRKPIGESLQRPRAAPPIKKSLEVLDDPITASNCGIMEVKTMLSLQSHVVHGYVGNRSATFPLQCRGWDVDVLNTVNYSNHTGYGSVHGHQTTAAEIRELYKGLCNIGAKYDAFLTGYVPGAEALEAVCEIGRDIKRRSPEMLWLLDPVMGDEGKLYVSETVIPVYRKVLQRGGVDIITPNQFEAELLVDFKINSWESLNRALDTLHTQFKVRHVTISSLRFASEGVMINAVTSVDGQRWLFDVPYIESYFTGVGDLFSALLIDRVHHYTSSKCQENYLRDAVNEVLSVMAIVLRVTGEESVKELGKHVVSKMGSAETMRACELRLIQCRGSFFTFERHFDPKPLH